jgi:PAS domain S-box-containing protein
MGRERYAAQRHAAAGEATLARQQAAIAALGLEAVRQSDLDALLAEATRCIADTLPADCCAVFELLPDRTALFRRASSDAAAQRVVISAGRFSQAGYTLTVGAPVVSTDLGTERRFDAAAARSVGLRCGITAIIHGRTRPFGVLGAFDRGPRGYSADDVSFVEAAASLLSASVARYEAEERHRKVVEVAQEVIWVHCEGRIVFANPFAARLLGLEGAAAMLGREAIQFVHPDDRERARQRVRRILDTGEPAPPADFRLLGADGQQFVVEMHSMLFLHEGVPSILSVGRDLTARRRAERALRDSEQRFRDFAEAASDWHWETGPDHRHTYTSPRVAELTGAPPGYFIGRTRVELFAPEESPERILAHQADLDAHRPFRNFTCAVTRPGGAVRYVRVSGKPVFDAQGAFRGYRGISTDVTAEREAERRLRDLEKLQAIGQIAGGVAHDFNNLLAVVIGCSELLLDLVGPDDQTLRPPLSQIEAAGLRGAALCRRLLALSRRQAPQLRALDLNRVVMDVEPTLRRMLDATIEVRTVLADELWTVLADTSELESALINLAINARDAMPGGGALTIETHNAELAAIQDADGAVLRPGAYAAIAVADTGTGMAAEVRRRAFDPFFTTKPAGRGSGLGLSTVRAFVRQVGGDVTIDSAVGVGTTITILLPRTTAEALAAVEPDPPPAASRGETILLVEDDPTVRAVVTRTLVRFGYRVREAGDGRTALELLQGGGPVDLVLADIVLPGGIDGWQMAQSLWRAWPRLPVLFTTGYADSTIFERALLDPRVRVLAKPFRQRELRAAVEEALRSGRG